MDFCAFHNKSLTNARASTTAGLALARLRPPQAGPPIPAHHAALPLRKFVAPAALAVHGDPLGVPKLNKDASSAKSVGRPLTALGTADGPVSARRLGPKNGTVVGGPPEPVSYLPEYAVSPFSVVH